MSERASFLEAVRKACKTAVWSNGVKLARDGRVVFAPASSADEVQARVRAPGVAVAPSVTLYVVDPEWTCDCGEPFDPCTHVAAAAIAWAQGLDAAAPAEPAQASAMPAAASVAAGSPPPVARAAHRLRYALSVRDAGLWCERVVVSPDGAVTPLEPSLASRIARRITEPPLDPTHDDLEVEKALQGRSRGFVVPTLLTFVLSKLEASEVTFEAQPVRVRAQVVKPCARVVDHERGAELVIERDPVLLSAPAPALGLCQGEAGIELRPLGATDLAGMRHERLPSRRVVVARDLAAFVSSDLPALGRQLPVEVLARRLPRVDRALRPRLSLEVDADGVHTLSVLASIVYGSPPVARVQGGELVYVGPSGGAAPLRDTAEEHRLASRVRDELHLSIGRRLDLDGVDAARFLVRLRDFDERAGGVLAVPVSRRPLEPKVTLGARTFDVVFELPPDTEGRGDRRVPEARRADPVAVLRALREGLPFAPLLGGGFAPLPADWLAKHGQRVADLLAAREADGSMPTWSGPELRTLATDLDLPAPPPDERLGALLQSFDAAPERPLPTDLRAELRPYQHAGVSWLARLRDSECGGVLADDMGLGKTLQAIGALQGRTLVVCPKSVVFNWEAELARFRPSLRVCRYHGPSRKLDPSADVVVTTYAILRMDLAALKAETWGAAILDEAQAIKNAGSQSAKAAFELPARFRLALSGTPIENHLGELWSVLRFALPGLLGSRSDFEKRFQAPIEAGDNDALAKLRARIRPFVLRRTKGEVAKDLPPRTEDVLWVELDDAERATYEAVLAATRKDIVERFAEGASVMHALEALLRLRQVACHRGLVPGQHAEGSSKVERLVEVLTELAAEGHRALVFSQWTSLLDRVEPHLRAAGLGWVRLDGSTADRQGAVARFQDPAGPPVMLLSLQAGGSGLNLTAADHVFLLDPWWNPAVEAQAADRAHRIGQDKPVWVQRLVAKDTVEERVLALAQKKRELADAALNEAGRAAALTRDDILALLA